MAAAIVTGALASAVLGGNIRTDAPGWTFTDAEAPVFKAGDCQKPQLSTNDTNANLRVFVSPCETIRAWVVRDWRGREVCAGETAPDGTIRLAPLPPGYYRGECGGEKFTFCVVPENRCRNLDSAFAADSALSGCSRRGAYECPWHGGDCWHVTAELLGKCGIVHTRERLEWGNFIEPKKGSRDFSRYLASARAMKSNGVVSTGMFHDTPPWMSRPGRKLPGDLLELYRFMEDAARTFEPYYDAWEFWNEEEIGFTTEPCWEYVAALKAFALGARAGSETTTILPGALSAVEHFGYGQNMFDSEIAKYVQAFNIHTYENPCDYDQWHASLRRFLAEAGIADWQVWLTESGTTLEGNGQKPGACGPQMAHTAEQEMVLAEFYPKSCILHRQAGISRSWYFLFGCYNDRGGARDWGSMRRDGTVKPVHAAMAAVSSELGDAELLGEKRLGEGVRGFVFLKPDGSRTLAFWSVSNLERESAPPIVANDEEERSISFAAPDGAYRLVDMMGTPAKVTANNGRISVMASRYPQYLSGLKNVDVDVPAAPLGSIARYTPLPDEDLTVVIRPETNPEDFSITGRKCVAELEKESGRIRIEVWNLSPEAKKGRLTVSCGHLVGGDGELELSPWGMATVDASFVPPESESRVNLDIGGIFNGRCATRVRIPVVNVARLLGECEAVPLPELDDPAAWKRNDSGCSYECAYDSEEQAVRFDVEWNTSSSLWFFPVHEFGAGETFAGGRYLEFDVKSRQDAPENHMYLVEVMCLYEDQPRKSAPFKAPTSEWEKRRVLLPDDSGEMTGFCVGGLIGGRKLSYWLRNFRLIKSVAPDTAPVPKAAQPQSCIGMTRWWDPCPGWWEKRHAEKLSEITAFDGEIDLVFVGDSITHNWEGMHGLGSDYGGKPLAELKKRYSVLNLGFGGDSTRNVLWRLQNGELDGYRAKCFMLLVGTNNWDDPKDTAAGVKAILDLIARKQPQARTILLPIFPSGATADHPWRVHKDKVNGLLKNLADGEKVVWHDFNARFLNPDGTFREGLMNNDDLHPLAPAYDIWAEEVTPLFEEIVGR